MLSRNSCRVAPAVALLAALCAADGSAQDVRILVQRSPLAGFRYHKAAEVFKHLQPGEPLDLVREAGNPHDANAVRVEWQGHKLGYIPRRDNAALAWAMDRGETPSARVVRRQIHPNPRRRIELEVFVR